MARNKDNKSERKLKMLKLVSGNTIIGNVLLPGCKQGQNTVNIHKPLEVVIMPDRNGQRTLITLMDFMPAMASDNVDVDRHNIICMTIPLDNLAELYEKATNPSPIAQPDKQLVLPPGA